MMGSQPDVVPDQSTAHRGDVLKKLLIVQAAMLAPMILMGQFWVLFELILIVPAWMAVSDKNTFKPRLLQLYIIAAVFGAVFLGVDAATKFSFFFTGITPTQLPDGTPIGGTSIVTKPLEADTPHPYVWLAMMVAYETTAAGVLIWSSILAWKIVKKSYNLPPAMAPGSTSAALLMDQLRGWTSGGQNPDVDGYQRQQIPTGPTGFTAFQGQGHRLGDPTAAAVRGSNEIIITQV